MLARQSPLTPAVFLATMEPVTPVHRAEGPFGWHAPVPIHVLKGSVMRITRVMGTAALASGASAFLLLASSGAAVADHTHAKVVGNGGCVVIAQGSGEARVDLPSAVFTGNPNVDIAEAEGRTHPLHVLVHQGVPGENMALYVVGPATDVACPAGFINR